MREKDENTTAVRCLSFLRRYVIFFALIAFVLTGCMTLFLGIMQKNTGIVFTKATVKQAAIITFANVVLISFVCAAADGIRRKIMIGRPVRRIISAAEKIMKGDFSVRIQPIRSLDSQDGFNVIIDYFNRMASELSGVETLRTDFIANVSHELKTPLAVIQNYGTMLQQPNLSEEKRLEYAKAITTASHRLADLISNILKLNKLENQQIFPVKEIFDLGEQLCESLLSFEEIWEKKNIDIDTDIEENVLLENDAELLMLVWNNLFSNAMKFTESGGKVSLSLKSDGDFAIVQIADSGCGISQKVGVHIFEKFYQGDTSHAAQGNGLGLALVKRVIDIVEGDISVESEVGKGSTFTVKLRRKENGEV